MTKKVKTSLQDRLLLFQSGGGRLKIIYQNKRAREVLSANTNRNSSRTIAAADRLLLFAAVATCVKRDRETETEHAVVSTKNFRLQVPCFKKLRFKKKVKTNTTTEVKKKEKSQVLNLGFVNMVIAHVQVFPAQVDLVSNKVESK